MEDLLSAYPGQIDIVLCHNDDTAIGAMNACKNAGISDVIIVGFDGNAVRRGSDPGRRDDQGHRRPAAL